MDAKDNKSVLLLSMPFADISIPSIQISLLETYLKEKEINASSIHLYLFAAEIYGLHHYSKLLTQPNDAYASQMVFSQFVFPDHWKSNYNHFKEYYTRNNPIDENEKTLSFELHCEKTKKFYEWVINTIPWDEFDVIGFSLNYGQLLPSLALAKKIKETDPEKTIVFGGTTTINELGKRIMEAFDYIDYIISGDGEEPLYQLISRPKEKYCDIPGLIQRIDGKAHLNNRCSCIDLDSLPFIDYSSFFQNLSMVSADIQQFFQLNGSLPIEISRGCWWNRCTFCNQRAYHSSYRKKHIDRFIEELDFLSDKHKTLSFQIIGSTLPKTNLRQLCNKIISLQKDFSFVAETRADGLKKIDYQLLSQAGFHTIQTGIETFSQHYLKKMDKGTSVIDNIAALKFCKQFGIKNEYNIITGFPNEESIDFKQTINTVSNLESYIDPPHISSFMVGFNSPIYQDLEKYNIGKLKSKRTDKIMFPDYILNKKFHFFYDFTPIQKMDENDWNSFMDEWKRKRIEVKLNACTSKKMLDSKIFYYVDGVKYIKIYDKRDKNNINIYILDEEERMVFLSCIDIISYDQLKLQCNTIDEEMLQTILNDLICQKIIFQENDRYLSMPLAMSEKLIESKTTENDTHQKQPCLINN